MVGAPLEFVAGGFTQFHHLIHTHIHTHTHTHTHTIYIYIYTYICLSTYIYVEFVADRPV
jgi:hypothetical protein